MLEIGSETWWTGLAPEPGVCPGVGSDHVIRSLPQLRFENITRRSVLDYFNNTWTMTEVLFSGLRSEEAFIRPPEHQLRHPLIFYFGHPACLYVNKLRVAGIIDQPVNEHFEKIFEVGVDEMSWDDMSKNQMRWPSVREVRAYRSQVYLLLKDLILNHPDLDPAQTKFSPSSPAWALVMGFEHERIHLETSSVLMREMPLIYLKKPRQWPDHLKANTLSFSDSVSNSSDSTSIVSNGRVENRFVEVKAGSVEIGKPLSEPTFGWDNEYGKRIVEVPAFQSAEKLTSNAEYLDFVQEGGYRNPAFWTEHGWKWRSFKNTKAPSFWISAGPSGLHEYKLRTIFEEIEFQPDWPVIVNFYEAEAYCQWKTQKEKTSLPYRLLSEAEHHLLRGHAQRVNALQFRTEDWNLNLRSGGECSVSLHQRGEIFDVFGNTWQWCEDTFNPLPGFEAHPYYEDFSTPCFDGRHHMIMGGSFASTGDEASQYARFHFRPHFFQHASFRVVQSCDGSAAKTSFHPGQYESSELLSQYLLLHFASAEEVMIPTLIQKNGGLSPETRQALNFPQRCADVVISACEKYEIKMGRALDLGCAVGGSSFALSRYFEKVVGVDLSASFISAAERLKSSEEISFLRKDQGDLRTLLKAKAPKSSRADRINFQVGDACHLPKDLFGFDAVLLANLLCRLPDPELCLRNMAGAKGLVRPGGLLVLVSPYSWLSDHTNSEKWLGARLKNGKPLSSSEAIAEILSQGKEFSLLEEDDMPLIIREHERKYQYIVSHLMVWRRRESETKNVTSTF